MRPFTTSPQSTFLASLVNFLRLPQGNKPFHTFGHIAWNELLLFLLLKAYLSFPRQPVHCLFFEVFPDFSQLSPFSVTHQPSVHNTTDFLFESIRSYGNYLITHLLGKHCMRFEILFPASGIIPGT